MRKLKKIKINKNNLEKLKNFSDNSLDANLNLLMDSVEQYMPFVNYNDQMTTGNVYPETCERLDGFHISASESRDNIVSRLFVAYEENYSDLSEWIPFKIINPYNNLLYLTGQVDYTGREISFNHDGNVFFGRFPDSYMVNGEDLSKEFHLWVTNVKWSEIINIVVSHKSNNETISNKDYILKINP